MLHIWFWIMFGLVGFGLLLLLSRWMIPILSIGEEDHSFLDPVQQIMGVIYGVLLAFVVVLSWQNYATLDGSMLDEATGLVNLWRDSRIFDQKTAYAVKLATIDYSDSIHNLEWPHMEKGETVAYNSTYAKLWESVRLLEPKTEMEKIFANAIINDLNMINKARRARLAAAEGSIPTVLWIFLIFGAAYVIEITLLYRASHMKLRIATAFIQMVIITFALYLIANFNHPFEGGLSITDQKFQLVTKVITAPDHIE